MYKIKIEVYVGDNDEPFCKAEASNFDNAIAEIGRLERYCGKKEVEAEIAAEDVDEENVHEFDEKPLTDDERCEFQGQD